MDLPPPDVWYTLPVINHMFTPPILSFVASGSVWHVANNGRWVRGWAGVYRGHALPSISDSSMGLRPLPAWMDRNFLAEV